MERRPDIIVALATVLAAIFDSDFRHVQDTGHVTQLGVPVVGDKDSGSVVDGCVVQEPRDPRYRVASCDALERDGVTWVGSVLWEGGD